MERQDSYHHQQQLGHASPSSPFPRDPSTHTSGASDGHMRHNSEALLPRQPGKYQWRPVEELELPPLLNSKDKSPFPLGCRWRPSREAEPLSPLAMLGWGTPSPAEVVSGLSKI